MTIAYGQQKKKIEQLENRIGELQKELDLFRDAYLRNKDLPKAYTKRNSQS